MSKISMLAGPLAIVALFVTSCAGGSSAPAERVEGTTSSPKVVSTQPVAPSITPKPSTNAPRSGGVLAKALNRDVASFDVHREQGADASQTLFNVYEGLVRLHPIQHEKIVPELAENWDVSPDGRTYTFKFAKDIKWQDGKSLTMEDVKYSLDRMHTPKAFNTISPRGEGLLVAVDTVEIAGDDNIKIRTKYPSASFLLNLATGWVAIQPKHIIMAKGDMRRDLVGTGPFKLKEFNPNISLELTKNPDYRINGLPYLDGIKFYTVKDGATRFSAFRTGQVKMTFIGSRGLTAAEAEIVKREMAGKATVYEHDALSRHVLTFNVRKKPWDDVRVRKAVDLAFDRQAAIKVNGKGRLGSVYPEPWGMKPEEAAKLPGYRQPKDADIAEAIKLLAEAGFPTGFKTTLFSPPGGPIEAVGVIAKAQLAKLGIDAEVTVMEQIVFYDRLERGAFDLFSNAWTDNTGDPDEILYTYYFTAGSRNRGDFSDKQIDDLIVKQAATLDVTARKEILAQIQKKILEVAPVVSIYWDLWQLGAWNEVKDFTPGPGIHPWGKLDQVWFAK